jgi:magnesium transporter
VGNAQWMPTALLFERHRVDEVDEWTNQLGRLGRRSILWIDLESPDREQIAELVENLELGPETEKRLESTDGKAFFGDFGSYLHVTAFAPSSDAGRADLVKVGCLVSEHWVVTVHETPLVVLEEFRERAAGSGDVGRLDGPELLADLLDWVLAGYRAAFEDIQLELEKFDTRAMRGEFENAEEELEYLVGLRHEIGGLRRALVSHRATFLALSRPELDAITRSEHAARFADLRRSLEEVVQAARDSRESVVGSFDVLVARTGHRTNEIMKVLTLVTVLLLPGALIAGIMGMNFKLGVFENNGYFWIVLALITGLAAVTLLTAKKRRWI